MLQNVQPGIKCSSSIFPEAGGRDYRPVVNSYLLCPLSLLHLSNSVDSGGENIVGTVFSASLAEKTLYVIVGIFQGSNIIVI